ncbi:D-threonate kinase [Bordetella sp. 2513F-2]
MSAPFIAIVADDLTGSGDTAVQFVRAGWSTQLSVGGAAQALADPAVRDAEVLAITTHSRPLAAAQAADVVRHEVGLLRAAGVRRMYKKVDSTLRGAFRAEIEAARLAWHDDAVAVVCPAFPATGRTLRQGVLYVGDVPVTETSAATDPVTPVTQSHVPTLLDCALVSPGADEAPEALARRLAEAGPVVVVDAATDADMARLARAVALLGERALPVGAGGLAQPLARVWAGADARGAVLAVVTSQHSASRRQARALSDHGAQVWAPTLDELADDGQWQRWSAQVCDQATGLPDAGVWLLLAPEGRRAGLDSDRVAQRLGELASRLILGCPVSGVIATGGDGASQVLTALQASGIALVDEVTGGVPLGTLTGGRAAGLPIVTKAGGFGDDDVLIRAAQAIRERRFKR